MNLDTNALIAICAVTYPTALYLWTLIALHDARARVIVLEEQDDEL